jgi:hypothetical protein
MSIPGLIFLAYRLPELSIVFVVLYLLKYFCEPIELTDGT